MQQCIIKRASSKPLSLPWQNHLILFSAMVVMALFAEVVSTSMTNTAPLWGFSPQEVYITASPNYFDVVFRHSVIVFLPQFFFLCGSINDGPSNLGIGLSCMALWVILMNGSPLMKQQVCLVSLFG